MSILADQNINNLNAVEAGEAGGIAGKWIKNLGRNSGFGPTGSRAGQGWAGFSYTPEGLSSLILSRGWRTGPQGKHLFGSGQKHQYGPKDFSRLSDSQPDLDFLPRYSSVLTSFAFMIGSEEPEDWASGRVAQNMKQTFTSGDQMISLWNRERGRNRGQTSVASGGQFRGYQANHKYGISNWSDVGKPTVTKEWEQEGYEGDSLNTITKQFEWALRSDTTGGAAATAIAAWKEENTTRSTAQVIIRSPLADIDHTGLRNIPGMMGPS